MAIAAGLAMIGTSLDASAHDLAPRSVERQAQRRRNRRRNRRHNEPPPPAEPAEPVANTPPEGSNEAPPTMVAQPPTTTEPVETPVEHPTRPIALDVGLAFRGIGRSLGFNNDANGAFRGYDLAFGPAIYAALEWFPGAHFTSNALAHIGLYGDFGYAFGISSQDTAGNTYATSSLLYDVGLRGRIPLGHFDLGIRAGYGAHSFSIADSGANPSGVPAVNYQFVRVGVTGRYDIADRVGIMLGFSYLITLGSGAYHMNFPHESVHGLDANIGLAVRVVAGLEVRVGFDFRAFLHSHNVQAGDPYMVEGATDILYGADFGLAYRF